MLGVMCVNRFLEESRAKLAPTVNAYAGKKEITNENVI